MSLSKRQPASFRDFGFLVPRNQLRDGRKTVTHEFVNSTNRFVEDLGQFPSKFTVSAIIHGADSIQQRDSFRALLNKPGPGILIHPSYGRQEVTVEGQYTVSESDTELGEFKFEITFARDSGAAFPRLGQPTTSTVASSELTARTSVLQRVKDQWSIPLTTISNSDAATKLTTYADDVAKDFSGIVADASEIIRITNRVKANASALVRSGDNVAGAIGDILVSLDLIPTETLATLNSIKSLLNFGASDASINNSAGLSIDQSNRILNQNLLNSAVQSTSLVKAYTTSTLVNFQIASRLDANRSQLAVASRSIISDIRSAGVQFDAASARGISVNTSRDRDAVNAILDTRSLGEKIMSQNEEALYRLSTVKVPLTSARLLSYALFEDDGETDIIADLNRSQKPSSLSGNLGAVNK